MKTFHVTLSVITDQFEVKARNYNDAIREMQRRLPDIKGISPGFEEVPEFKGDGQKANRVITFNEADESGRPIRKGNARWEWGIKEASKKKE